MTRGRKPKPTEIKRMTGNPGKRALNSDAPTFPAAILTRAPRVLSPQARRLWRDLAPVLAGAGLLTIADLPAFTALCMHFGMMVEAAQQVKAEGATIMASMGETRKHPATSLIAENSRALKSYLVEFGLSPSSRVRLKGMGEGQDSSLAEMLFASIDGDSEEGEEGEE